MAEVMNALKDKEREQALREMLQAAGRGKDEEELEFVRVLGYVEGEEVTAYLTKLAEEVQPFVVAAALEALGRQNAPASIPTLQGRLQDGRWQIRVAALEGLSYYRDVGVVEALLARVESEDGVLQRHYFAALSRMFGHAPGSTLKAFQDYWAKNREDVIKRWNESPRDGPVKEAPPPVMVAGGDDEGSTSFYGIKTRSKHIIFVIDVSGSMGPEHGGVNAEGKSRIDIVKTELTNAIRSTRSSRRS
jgi:hypothetical protein